MRPMYEKVKYVKDATFYTAWNKEHTHCMCCGLPDHFAANAPHCGGIGLTTHHIIRPGRSDEATNLLRLCNLCHQLAEGLQIAKEGREKWPTLSVGHCLRIKAMREPEVYDPVRLATLRGRNLPEQQVLPDCFAESWCEWMHPEGCACQE